MAAQQQPPIILIKRRRARGAAHHGGSWKVAYADFVTAMMAFFMVMWLAATMPQEKLGGIADYFKNPSAVRGQTTTLVQGTMGPGGAGDTPIKMFSQVKNPPGAGSARIPGVGSGKTSDDAARRALEKADKAKLELLKKMMEQAIGQSQAMRPFKDQLVVDITPEGLRIQIIDALNRPMFDMGSPELKSYTRQILVELAKLVDQVPNRVAISGHTDTTPYAARNGYSNWELSAERANAARRALIEGGMRHEKLARVVGLSSSVPFNRKDPADPRNRRISLVVLSREAERAAQESEAPQQAGNGAVREAAMSPAPAGERGTVQTAHGEAGGPGTGRAAHPAPPAAPGGSARPVVAMARS